jgi:hypothetical protein
MPILILFSNEAWLYLSENRNFQNNRYWCAQNPMPIHGVPLCDINVGVWMSATEIIVPISYWDHNSHQLVTDSSDTISFIACLNTKTHMPFPA